VVASLNVNTQIQTLYFNDGTQSATSSSGTFPTISHCNLGYSNWDSDTGLNGFIDRFDISPSLFAASDVGNVWTIPVTSLSYSPSSVSVAVWGSVLLVPTVTYAALYGGGTSYTVSPPLPAGIVLNPLTGLITGSSSLNSGPYTYTITATNQGGTTSAVVTIQVGLAGSVSFYWSGSSPGAGALSQLVVYTSAAAGVVGLQATFGNFSSPVVGASSATFSTVALYIGEYIANVTSWSSGSMITGLQFVGSSGRSWGPYGVFSGPSILQGVPSQALVAISGSSLPNQGLISPLQCTWLPGPYSSGPGLFGETGSSWEISTPRSFCGGTAPYIPVQTITFFFYNGSGSKVPNYICGYQISANGVPSVIAAPFNWPGAANISYQTIFLPPGDVVNRMDVVDCNPWPGYSQMCGVTITTLRGVVLGSYGTTQQQAVAAGAFNQIVPLNYLQNAPSCLFRGFFGTQQMLNVGGHSIPYNPSSLRE